MKLITDPKVLQTMFEANYILNKPGTSGRCELTVPDDLGVDYEVDKKLSVLAYAYALNKVPDDLHEAVVAAGNNFTGLRLVYLKEPECGPGWCVIHESNKSALRFETKPEKEEYNDLITRIKMHGNDKPEFDDEE